MYSSQQKIANNFLKTTIKVTKYLYTHFTIYILHIPFSGPRAYGLLNKFSPERYWDRDIPHPHKWCHLVRACDRNCSEENNQFSGRKSLEWKLEFPLLLSILQALPLREELIISLLKKRPVFLTLSFCSLRSDVLAVSLRDTGCLGCAWSNVVVAFHTRYSFQNWQKSKMAS